MIRHTVIFNLNHAPGSLQEKAFLRDARLLAGLPGVENFEILRQLGENRSHRFALSMTFKAQADYDGYLTHPKHLKFLRDRWDREVTDFVEFDGEPA